MSTRRPKQPSGVCRLYQNGSCRYGSNCKFSHDKGRRRNTTDASSFSPTARRIDYEARSEALSKCQSLLFRPPISRYVSDFWAQAYVIASGDSDEQKQQFTKLLLESPKNSHSSNYGKLYIDAILQYDFVNSSDPVAVLSFLRTITHSSLLRSLTMDGNVSVLFNYIGKDNGEVSGVFFTAVIRWLEKQMLKGNTLVSFACTISAMQVTFADVISDMTIAMTETLQRNQRAAYCLSYTTVAVAVQSLLQKQQQYSLPAVENHIAVIKRLCQRAQNGLDTQLAEGVTDLKLTPSAGPLQHMIKLAGGRHDNDHTDFSKICIFPTLEEIQCDQPNYLPRKDHAGSNLDGMERHLDRHFRLLREDVLADPIEKIDEALRVLRSRQEGKHDPLPFNTQPSCHFYENAMLERLSFSKDKDKGLEVQVCFSQLPQLRKLSPSDREKWWESRKRLEEGSLACFVAIDSGTAHVIWFSISRKISNRKDPYGLSSGSNRARIIAKGNSLLNETDVNEIVKVYQCSAKGMLLAFPSILSATFSPILRSLQKIAESGSLPFSQWICPDSESIRDVNSDSELSVAVPPPAYARSPGFSFDLSAILNQSANKLELPVSDSAAQNLEFITALEVHTSLDRGQCEALISALTQEFALIQGPPGTGKSYVGVQLMQVLLSNRDKASLGPVIVVCYTNHALDQFLEHLSKAGISNWVRVGSQSKSALVGDHLLNKLSQSIEKTRNERYVIGSSHSECDNIQDSINKTLSHIDTVRRRKWNGFKKYMLDHHNKIHSQFERVDEEGFEKQTKFKDQIWDQWVSGKNAPSSATVPFTFKYWIKQAEGNIFNVPKSFREILLKKWSTEILSSRQQKLNILIQDYYRHRSNIQAVYDDLDRRCLQSAHVIGMTTTGLAMKLETIRKIDAKVVLCEEAGEVLESHVLCALLPSVEHIIQIGDHEQLRPKLSNNSLSKENFAGSRYSLDESMFERLSTAHNNRIPISQLNIQRRMRPSIADLVRNTLYPMLEDHQSTHYPDVVGLKKNLFWLDHNHEEDSQGPDEIHTKSRSNEWEVKMVCSLVKHIVRQGEYKSNEIAVLTPYVGQLQKLRKGLKSHFEIVLSDRDVETLAQNELTEDEQPTESPAKGPLATKTSLADMLRIATVDNFQGEEAKIIIISFVRSNKERKVGFLKTSNRINVLLSRAQHGMYIIGNAITASSVDMWSNVMSMLQEQRAIGSQLELCCPRHQDTILHASEPDDFATVSPEGGCGLICDKRLEKCGHQCKSPCHSDFMHGVYYCAKACERQHEVCKHRCERLCGDDCGRCLVDIEEFTLPCGHIGKVKCWQTREPASIKCQAKVVKLIPGCDHSLEVKCFIDVTSPKFRCVAPCQTNMDCGHSCTGLYHDCRITDEAVKHNQCNVVCGRKYSACSHSCEARCHNSQSCEPCSKDCEVRCAHSKCSLRCHEGCAPCIEPCTWSCSHRGSCNMPCSAPCDRLPCDERCEKILSCGHQCPFVCGEDCPTEEHCQLCCTDDVRNARVDLLGFATFSEINLNDTPIVLLSCGHYFTVESLDGMLQQDHVYKQNLIGEFTGLENISSGPLEKPPCCPDCRQQIQQFSAKRYGRVLNRSAIDEITRRSETHILRLQGQLRKLLDDLTEAILQHISSSEGLQLSSSKSKELLRSKEVANKLRHQIRKLNKQTLTQNQPAKKLYDSTLVAHKAHSHAREILEGEILCFASPGRGLLLNGDYLDIVCTSQILSIDLKLKCSSGGSLNSEGEISKDINKFLQQCRQKSREAFELMKYSLATEIYACYGRFVLALRGCQQSGPEESRISMEETVNTAKVDIESAIEICNKGFTGAAEMSQLLKSIYAGFASEFYTDVSAQERAMVSEAMKIELGSTTGHWYNCVNGHPVSSFRAQDARVKHKSKTSY
jgi:hypothetical protein